jgi:glutamate dehydrogenase (NAD(P)+)
VACDIWIPAARPDVINAGNADRLRTKLVLQGANIPFTDDAEQMLYNRGIVIVPDFVANAGGVICAAMEYHGATRAAAFAAIAEKIKANTDEVLRQARARKVPPRDAAAGIAVDRVKRAMRTRRFGVF